MATRKPPATPIEVPLEDLQKKNFLGLSDNVTYLVEQVEGAANSYGELKSCEIEFTRYDGTVTHSLVYDGSTWVVRFLVRRVHEGR